MPLLHAACVAADDRFAIAYGQFEYDDPFFIIIDYDQRAAQPWTRRDVRREMSTIISLEGRYSQSKYAALSREGDVYFIADTTSNERILGAGLASPDSKRMAEVFDLTLIGNSLWAVGGRGQIYSKSQAGWNEVGIADLEALDLGAADFGRIAGIREDDIYVSYTLPADEAVVPDDEREKLQKDNSWAAWREAYKRADARRIRKSATRGLLHWTGHKLDDLPLPLSPLRTIDALFANIDGYVYVAGDEGVVAYGNHMTGFKPFNVIGLQDRVSLSSISRARSTYLPADACSR
jgi:hypothetical protein